MKRLLFWSLFALTLAVYATMLGWSLPTVSAAAGGLPPFDMRPAGYSFADAQAFLAALTPEGVRFYRDVQLLLDIFYPALLAMTLFFAVAGLLPRQWGRWRWLPGAAALPIAVFDYLENAAVARLMEGGVAGLSPGLVAEASQWTVLKSGATTLVMSGLLLLLVFRGGAALLKMVAQRRGVAPPAR